MCFVPSTLLKGRGISYYPLNPLRNRPRNSLWVEGTKCTYEVVSNGVQDLAY